MGGKPAGLQQAFCPTRARRRLTFVMVGLTLVFLFLVWRLFDLQILRHEQVSARVQKMFISYDESRGLRGDILTRDGTILAREVTEYLIALDPTQFSLEGLSGTIDLLCRGLRMSDEERRAVHASVARKKALAARGLAPESQYILLKRGVEAGLVSELKAAVGRILPAREQRGIISRRIHFRHYPRDSLLGVLVGATKQGPGGEDLVGQSGVELMLNSSLSGKDGMRKLLRDGRHRGDRWYRPGEVEVLPVAGYNAVLTVHSRIQGIAEEELEKGVEVQKADAGVAIVMNCRNGDILAMACWPPLDPNHFHEYPQEEFRERRKNRAVESQYEPGSTIKPFVLAVALALGVVRPDQMVWGGGDVHAFGGRRRVTDVRDHGPITAVDAVVYSSNIGMAHIGLLLGQKGLEDMLHRFQLGKLSGVGLPGEAEESRHLREHRKKNWSELYTSISVSFGYRVMVTPLQLCTAFCSLVNGGTLFHPRIVDHLERGGEVIEFPHRVRGHPIQEETSRRMREILVEVVERGTGKYLKIPGLNYGGKTGTTEIAGNGTYSTQEYISSFMAFAPAEDPRVVVLVMIERPKFRHYGSSVAGPVVKGILETIYPPTVVSDQ